VTHDGYAPLVHRRAVFARPGCWMIADRVLGDGDHQAEADRHLDPRWTVTAGDGWLRADDGAGDPVWMRSLTASSRSCAAARLAASLARLGRAGHGHVVPSSTLRLVRWRRAVHAGDGAARSGESSFHRGLAGYASTESSIRRQPGFACRRRRHRYRRV
jgi:hypothetical protein